MALASAPSQPDSIVSVQESTDVATARRVAMTLATKAGFTEEEVGAAAIIVTEAASNLLKHGSGGDVIVRNITFSGKPLIEITAIDRGRGMTSVARCFEDGYSTGGSPGTGLGAIARLSKFHDVYSVPEKGTVLLARAGLERGVEEELQIGAINVPYPGEELCGDAWNCETTENGARFTMADGLGHGAFAAEAASIALKSIGKGIRLAPAQVLESAHAAMKATRGAAVALVDIDLSSGRAIFSGVGNISGAIVSPLGAKRQMVSINGTLGHHMGKPRQYEYPFDTGSLLILHSDGLSAHWNPETYPGLFHRHPGVIAGVLFRDFRRIRDDATVLVVRWNGARGEDGAT